MATAKINRYCTLKNTNYFLQASLLQATQG